MTPSSGLGKDRKTYIGVQDESTPTSWLTYNANRAINGGSPYNVPAGHGSANLEHLVAMYKEKFHKEEAEKIEKLKARGEF